MTRPKNTARMQVEHLQELIDELQLPSCEGNWIFFNEIKIRECTGTKDATAKLEALKAIQLIDIDVQKYIFNHKLKRSESILVKFSDGKFYSVYTACDNSEEYYRSVEGLEVFNCWEDVAPVIEAADNAKYVGEWKAITHRDYWDALECLPPMLWRKGSGCESFFICEATTSNIHSCYIEMGDKYYTAMRRTSLKHTHLISDLNKQLEAA